MRRGTRLLYRGYNIARREYRVPHPRWPLVDWEWWHPDYDGAMDSRDSRAGFGPSFADMERQIDANIEENL